MKLNFTALGCAPVGELLENERHCATLGLKRLGTNVGARPLAVVGGGPSVSGHLAELQAWQGDVWAINGAWQWCRENGIKADFFSIDPAPALAEIVRGVPKAYLATCCHPSVFEVLKDADVTVFDIMKHLEDGNPERITNGPTSATTSPFVACRCGYKQVTFFGCEGSYSDIAHPNVYPATIRQNWLKVSVRHGCGHVIYLTDAELCMQSEVLSGYIRAIPQIYSEKSGGLLEALCREPDWRIAELSPEMQERTGLPVCP